MKTSMKTSMMQRRCGRWLGVLTLSLGFALTSQAGVTHRYSFEADASDSVGGANGTLEGTAAIAAGQVLLDGTAGTYVNLPPGLISGLTEVSFEAWVTFWPGGNWSRLFDFGAFGASDANVGRNYVLFTPHSGPGDHRLSISDADPGWQHEEMVTVPGVLDDGTPRHIVAVLQPETGWEAVYVDGVLAGWSRGLTIPLSSVAPDNCFLGRSLYAADAWANADIDEFRILDQALTSAEVAASFLNGPDVVDYSPGDLLALDLMLPPQIPEGGIADPEVSGTYALAGVVDLGPGEATLTSSDPNIVEVLPGGTLKGKAPGSAQITAELDGVQTSSTLVVQAAPVVLKHRYSFGEAAGAQEVVDSVGGANGALFPSQDGTREVALGDGQAVFPGGAGYQDAAYIDLPDGIISELDNVTIEVWTTWNGPAGSYWQRVFDFGNSAKGEDPHNSGNGTGAFFLTPLGGVAGSLQYNAGPTGFGGEQILNSSAGPLVIGQETHVVCTYAPASRRCEIWVDGRLVASSNNTPFALADLQDVNNWLGASGWNDPPFNGSINELRIYDGALTEFEIVLNHDAGPDTLPPAPGLLQTVRVETPPVFLGNPNPTPAALLADFENVQDVNVSLLSGATFSSSDPEVFTVTDDGGITPVSLGTAELTATFQGLTAKTEVTVLAPTSLALRVDSPLTAGGAPVTARLEATYPGDLKADVNGFAGAAFSSSNPATASIDPASGLVVPIAPGATTLSGSFSGLEATATLTVEWPAGHETPALIHRYSFGEASGATVVTDSVGGADGELINPSANSDFTGTGRLKLEGGGWNAPVQSGYVNLPNGLVSSLKDATFEGWIRWNGPAGSSWQRIFDFGRNAADDGTGNPLEDEYQNPGLSYMYLSPRSGDNTLRFAIKQGDGPELPQLNSAPVPVGEDLHFAVVYDVTGGTARMFVNGRRVATGLITHPLSVVEDVNVYLGRSQWTDPYFAGEFDEFRIYSGALTDGDLARSYAAGPDQPVDLTPAPPLTAALEGGNVVIRWPADAAGFGLQTSPALGPNASWSAVEQAPVEENGRFNVTLPVVSGDAFFRLAK